MGISHVQCHLIGGSLSPAAAAVTAVIGQHGQSIGTRVAFVGCIGQRTRSQRLTTQPVIDITFFATCREAAGIGVSESHA